MLGFGGLELTDLQPRRLWEILGVNQPTVAAFHELCLGRIAETMQLPCAGGLTGSMAQTGAGGSLTSSENWPRAFWARGHRLRWALWAQRLVLSPLYLYPRA